LCLKNYAIKEFDIRSKKGKGLETL
jgi:hypothetical protein